MEHQVQGLQYVNGEWVSRPVDIYRIMAQARRQEDTAMREPEPKPKYDIPRLGILSKTVLASPYIKFILPANIRQTRLNDVVFVGEDAVHLREVCSNGSFRHIASKCDFRGRILAARVFGSPRKVEVKPEQRTPIKKREVHAQRRSTIGQEADILPPEVLVLTLDSRILMFLWALQSPSGSSVSFHHKTIQLPGSGPNLFHNPGNFLAIDPRCRAIAVAAAEGQFVLYKTKSLENWREEVRTGHDTTAVEDERVFPIDGRIMHMEFLSPGASDDSHVVLIFVVAHKGKTKLTCYDWDARFDLSTATARVERLNVDTEDHFPSLLIPLSRSPDFLLVCDRHITTYKTILSGTVDRIPTPIRTELTPLQPSDNKSQPRWVQWHRVARNDDYPKEALYIAREDGRVLYVGVPSSKVAEPYDAGQMLHPIDKGFACLDVDVDFLNQLQPDVLVAAGTTSDGSLSKIGSWIGEGRNMDYLDSNAVDFVESIPNWAPVHDVVITRLPGIRSPYERERDSIFITNGRAPQGSATELRRGIKAPVDIYSTGMTGCTRVAIIDYGGEPVTPEGRKSTSYVVLLASMPPETLVLRFIRCNGEWQIEQMSDESTEDGLLRSDETMSACILSEQASVQITRGEARTLSRPELVQLDTRPFSTPLIAATSEPNINCIAVAYHENNQPTLHVIEVQQDGRFGADAQYGQLPCDPTCIELMNLDGVIHVLVATTDSSVLLFAISQSGLELVDSYNLQNGSISQDLSTVCDSAVLLASGDQQAILCGTRNGLLVGLSLETSTSRVRFGSASYTRLGTTAVKLRRYATDPSLAFVACGIDFCRARIQRHSASALSIDSIWLTDIEHEDYQHSPVTAIDQLPRCSQFEDADHSIAGFMFVVSGERLLLAQHDGDVGYSRVTYTVESRAVPRKLTFDVTPNKMLYSLHLRKFIVATMQPKEERAPPHGYRTIRSAIHLVNPANEENLEVKQEQDNEASKNRFIVAELQLKNYERVYSMLEWIITDSKSRPHHFIYIGTGVMDRPGQETGRRLFLQVDSNWNIKVKKEKAYDRPVRCMALFRDTCLVTVVGNILMLEEYEPQNAKWARRARTELPSDGVHLSVDSEYIYVSTAMHSHICYCVKPVADTGDRSDFWGHATLEKVFTDSRTRESTYHTTVTFPSHAHTNTSSRHQTQSSSSMDIDDPPTQPPAPTTTVLMLSDKRCNVAGLLRPPHRMNKSDTHTFFEAQLPRSVTRLQHGDIRPPWRRPLSGPPIGILADDIIGTCSDGAVYNFTILSSPALRLLKLVQNLIELKEGRKPSNQHSVIQSSGTGPMTKTLLGGPLENPLSTTINLREVDPDEGRQAAKKQHVSADTILRYFDGDVFKRGFDEEDSLLGLLSAGVDQEVGMKFAEIAVELGFTYERGQDRELVERVRVWMRDILAEVL